MMIWRKAAKSCPFSQPTANALRIVEQASYMPKGSILLPQDGAGNRHNQTSPLPTPHLDLLKLSPGTSTPQPSELVKASPYLMSRLTEGTITLGEAEWWALGAELQKEKFSQINFYRAAGRSGAQTIG